MAMSVSEAARRAGTSTSAIYAGIRRGTIKAVKKGRSWAIVSLGGVTKKRAKKQSDAARAKGEQAGNKAGNKAGKKTGRKQGAAVGAGGVVGAYGIKKAIGSKMSKIKAAKEKAARLAKRDARVQSKLIHGKSITKRQAALTKGLRKADAKTMVENLKGANKQKYAGLRESLKKTRMAEKSKTIASKLKSGKSISAAQAKDIKALVASKKITKAKAKEMVASIKNAVKTKNVKAVRKARLKKAGKYGAGLALGTAAAYGIHKAYTRKKKKKK